MNGNNQHERGVAVADAVAAILPALRARMGDGIALTWRPEPGLPPALIGITRLEDIVYDLVDAARRRLAGRADARLVLSLHAASDEEAADWPSGAQPTTHYIQLTAVDNGPENAPASGPVAELVDARRIAERAGGFLLTDSDHRVCRVLLPVNRTDTAATPRRARILLVDDDHELGPALARTLARTGHQVNLALHAEQAEAIAAASPPFDLVVTDILLPGRSGLDLLARLREREPNLPALLMSGLRAPEQPRVPADDAKTRFIGKPFTTNELLSAIDEMITPGP